MKTAVMSITVLEFHCPYCGECIGNLENNSHLWTLEQKLPKSITCHGCKAALRVPARARNLQK
jgi:MinD superfamily P-loop ATPase